jgi:hypothetical protein
VHSHARSRSYSCRPSPHRCRRRCPRRYPPRMTPLPCCKRPPSSGGDGRRHAGPLRAPNAAQASRARARPSPLRRSGPRAVLDRANVRVFATAVGARVVAGSAVPACGAPSAPRFLARARVRFVTADSAVVTVDVRCQPTTLETTVTPPPSGGAARVCRASCGLQHLGRARDRVAHVGVSRWPDANAMARDNASIVYGFTRRSRKPRTADPPGRRDRRIRSRRPTPAPDAARARAAPSRCR